VDDILTDSFEALISEQCDLARVRRIEAGESAVSLWSQLHESGFIDALVPSDRGGAGLALRDIAGLILACGRHALPVPLAQSMFARAALAEAGIDPPIGAITLADRVVTEADGRVRAHGVPFGLTADWVWIPARDTDWLLSVTTVSRDRSGGHGSLSADLYWSTLPSDALRIDVRADARHDVKVAGAAFTAALLAGAMARAGEMSIAYANERVQFGKPIGKLQAIQQQLSVLCEHMYAARSAALLGLSASDRHLDIYRAATAKSRTSEAALTVATVAHAVHGAIGITAEYDLQMFTRRLHDWRRDYGSEIYWNGVLGGALLDGNQSPLEFVRLCIAPRGMT
jgi:acyl-CoA dehydrogenase